MMLDLAEGMRPNGVREVRHLAFVSNEIGFKRLFIVYLGDL